jgi:D-alanyl-D-alanine carboxypeptidase
VERQTVAARPAEHVVEPAVERHVERLAYAEESEFSADDAGPPRRASAPIPPASVPPRERVEKAEKAPAVRPAFVSGVQKRVADEALADKKPRAKAAVRQEAVIDGSTSSRGPKSKEIVAAATTPSAIRQATSVAKPEVARPTKPGWMIQIGAAEDPEKANQLLARARSQLAGFPSTAKAFTEKVQKGKETLYRARFAGLEEESAQSACKALKRSGISCFPTKN